jgi:hypothetical protein
VLEFFITQNVRCFTWAIAAVTALCIFTCPALAQTDTVRLKTLYDQAHRAIVSFENNQLENIVSQSPEVLLERNQSGISLIEFAFSYYNEDHVTQTNFEFIVFLVSNDFFGQKVDRANHLSLALDALRGADRQINRIDLSDDMVVHRSREPFIALLSQTINGRVSREPLESEESMRLILELCDAKAFKAGQEVLFSDHFTRVVTSGLSTTHRRFIGSYVKTGILNAICTDEFLN